MSRLRLAGVAAGTGRGPRLTGLGTVPFARMHFGGESVQFPGGGCRVAPLLCVGNIAAGTGRGAGLKYGAQTRNVSLFVDVDGELVQFLGGRSAPR